MSGLPSGTISTLIPFSMFLGDRNYLYMTTRAITRGGGATLSIAPMRHVSPRSAQRFLVRSFKVQSLSPSHWSPLFGRTQHRGDVVRSRVDVIERFASYLRMPVTRSHPETLRPDTLINRRLRGSAWAFWREVRRPATGVVVVLSVGATAVLGAVSALAQAMSLQSADGATVTPMIAYKIISSKSSIENLNIVFAKVRLKGSSSVPEIYWITEKPSIIWIAEKESSPHSLKGLEWADSRSCPSFASIAAALDPDGSESQSDFPGGHNVSPSYEIDSLKSNRSDGTSSVTRLTGPAGGRIAIQVQTAVIALASCWTSTRPKLG